MTEKKATKKPATAPADAAEPETTTESKTTSAGDVGQAELQEKADARRANGFVGKPPTSETTQT